MKIASIFFALAVAVTSANAAVTVSISTAPTGAQFFLSDGTTVLPDGSHFRIGTFTAVPAANATFATLKETFQEFAITTSGSSSAPNTGRTNRTNIAGATTGLADSEFVGDKIYIWVYNAPGVAGDPPADSPTLQQGVFSTTVTTATFKDQATAVALSTANLDQAFGSYVSAGGTAASTTGATGAVTRLTLAAQIPEASTFTLSALAVLGLMRRKRN
jgi:hypothetical protein